jgi:hypothetical protein
MSKEKYKLPEHYFAYNDGTPSHEIEDCIIQECESAGLDIYLDEGLAEERGYDQAFVVTNPYKDKIKKIKNLNQFVISLRRRGGIKNERIHILARS